MKTACFKESKASLLIVSCGYSRKSAMVEGLYAAIIDGICHIFLTQNSRSLRVVPREKT